MVWLDAGILLVAYDLLRLFFRAHIFRFTEPVDLSRGAGLVVGATESKIARQSRSRDLMRRLTAGSAGAILLLADSACGTRHKSESNVVDVLSRTVFRGFHHVNEIIKTRISGQPVGEILPGNFANRADFDLTILEPVAAARFDAGSFPNADAAGHLTALHACTEFSGKKHVLRY
jgi:hypothetical protein